MPTGWSKSDIESKIKESGGLVHFKEIHLTETEGSGGGEQKGAVRQTSETRKYEGTGTDEKGHTWKIKATYTFKDNVGNVQWEADDSQGNHMTGTFPSSNR
jgi:hypothetical protein